MQKWVKLAEQRQQLEITKKEIETLAKIGRDVIIIVGAFSIACIVLTTLHSVLCAR